MAKAARVQRLESELQRVLSQLVQREVRDPRVGAVTLTRVALSSDLREARIGFVPFGGGAEAGAAASGAAQSPTLAAISAGLARASGFLRGEAGRSLGLRHAPKLTFEFDDSIERASRLSQLIDSAVRDDARPGRERQDRADDAEP